MLRWVLSILGALALIAAIVTYVVYHRDIGAARAQLRTGSRIISTPCGPIEYSDFGTGMPVLAIHGAGGGFDAGLQLGQRLLERGFRVISPSRFGYLRTPLPADASPMAQADAHACLLDALNIDRAAVLAASAGSPSAMQLCPLLKATMRSDFLFWVTTRLPDAVVLKTFLGTPVEDFKQASPRDQAETLALIRKVLPIEPRSAGMWNDSVINGSVPRYDLERITARALLIAAQDDLYKTHMYAQYSSEHMRNARLVSYATGGHILIGHPEAFDEIAGFLLR